MLISTTLLPLAAKIRLGIPETVAVAVILLVLFTQGNPPNGVSAFRREPLTRGEARMLLAIALGIAILIGIWIWGRFGG